VAAQMEILPDGCFAGETEDLTRPVGFRMHQYAPYDLKLKGMKGSLVDVGTIHMTRLREDQMAGLKGKVTLEENEDPSKAVLYVRVAYYGPMNAPESSRGSWPKPVEIHVPENGIIEASGFSPFIYGCSITAPGYVNKAQNIGFKAGQAFDLGTITLEKPRQIRLSYIVSAEPPFDLNDLKTVTIPAGTKWKAVDDANRYGWDLEFGQENGFIIMNVNDSCGFCYLRDLGNGEIADYVNVDKTIIGQNSPEDQKAKDEHVYLFYQKTWKRWVLFRMHVLAEGQTP
jgi:hypothetical protein